MGFIRKTRPNWARKVRELILFNVLCTVYCGRGCLSLESEGKEIMRGCVNFCCGQRTDGRTDIRGVLRGPRGPKKLKNIRRYFCEWRCYKEWMFQSLRGHQPTGKPKAHPSHLGINSLRLSFKFWCWIDLKVILNKLDFVSFPYLFL